MKLPPGGVLGTPAYMAPEQCEGGPAGAVDDPKARRIVFDDLPVAVQQYVRSVVDAGSTRRGRREAR